MNIGEIAKKTGLTIDTLRYYEKINLIPKPHRAENGYREYSQDSILAISFITQCRALDIPITEIKKLLFLKSSSQHSCKEANKIIEQQLINLRERIKTMKKLEKQLAQLKSICNQELDAKDCPILLHLQRK